MWNDDFIKVDTHGVVTCLLSGMTVTSLQNMPYLTFICHLAAVFGVGGGANEAQRCLW